MRKINIAATVILTAGAIAIPSVASAYTVQPGDTLSAIAVQHKTSVSQLVELNKVPNPDLIYPGQEIVTNGSVANPVKEYNPPKTVKKVAPNTAVTSNSAKNEIIRRESSGNPYAVNPASGASGLFQCETLVHSCPALGDVAGQNAWADNYVKGRYGSWEKALVFHNSHGWY